MSCDIATDPVLIQSDLLCITETQISESSDLNTVTTNFSHFEASFNNNNDKFCSLATLHRDTVQVVENNLMLIILHILKLTKQNFSEDWASESSASIQKMLC